MSEPEDFVVCRICGKRRNRIHWSHLRVHNITFDEYRKKYPEAPTISEKYSTKISVTLMGNKYTLGSKRTDETKAKMSVASMGKKNARFGETLTDETKEKIRAAATGRKHTDEQRAKRSAATMGSKRAFGHRWKLTDEQRAKRRGENNPNYKDGRSSWPYCPKFTQQKREETRNKYGRTCVISGISALQNGQRLSVDHYDENKMQGCNGVPWRLIPLSRSVHGRMNSPQNHLLLELIIFGNKLLQMNYIFPEEIKGDAE